ncbi:MAG: sigma 54-interacting transcriptional regulator [Treponema sp.]
MSISEHDVSGRLAALMRTALFTGACSSSQDRLLEAIVRAGMQAAGCTAASLFLADELTQEVRLTAYCYQGVFHRMEEYAGLSATAARVLKLKKPAVSDSPGAGISLPAEVHRILYSAEQTAAAPLCAGDVCFGVLEAAGKRSGFSDTDLDLLSMTAAYAALVYRTAYLYRLYAGASVYAGQDNLPCSTLCIAASASMYEKFELCRKLADSDVPVLFIGENSVGKAFLARYLHLQSRRAAYPFIRVNCAEPSPDVLDVRLFGNQEETQPNLTGAFEQAAGGTLFLDEAAALPLNLQKKAVERLRTLESAGTPLRLLASTERNIEQLLHRGGFLSELYGKLNVLPLYIPPLRQRAEDILPFALFFLHRYARKLNKNFTGFSADAETALLNAGWAGNIRELKNTVEFGCLHGQPPLVTRADLCARSAETHTGGTGAGRLKPALDAFKREHIRAVLEKNHWNQTAAAAVLGIQRTYLSRLMKELNIKITRHL